MIVMQKKSLVLAIVLLVLVAQGCYYSPPTTTPQQTFQMQLRVDKSVYRIGENIVITVQASRDCYLSLWDTSTQGEVTRIFPNRFASDNFLRGGTAYRIPDRIIFCAAGRRIEFRIPLTSSILKSPARRASNGYGACARLTT
jgi:hypothetical protein